MKDGHSQSGTSALAQPGAALRSKAASPATSNSVSGDGAWFWPLKRCEISSTVRPRWLTSMPSTSARGVSSPSAWAEDARRRNAS